MGPGFESLRVHQKSKSEDLDFLFCARDSNPGLTDEDILLAKGCILIVRPPAERDKTQLPLNLPLGVQIAYSVPLQV